MKKTIFWFRRDLRLDDNTALFEAISNHECVLPIFIFDDNILDELPSDDPRVSFIYKKLSEINNQLLEQGSPILILKGRTENLWKELIANYSIKSVYTNKDYEPYAIARDQKIKSLLNHHKIEFFSFKDQVIHEEDEVLKNDGGAYTVYTPYKNKWLERYQKVQIKPTIHFESFNKENFPFPSLEDLGFKKSSIEVRDYRLNDLENYEETRNFPIQDATSYLGPHLRFGTISVRQIIAQLDKNNSVFLSELIWREFFMQILYHFPHVVDQNFRAKYDGIQWRNNKVEFEKWCKGETGYPMVDAGMRQLNQTGYMHNRVRMITAGFLCKHLLIDWRWGEAYFAEKLLDYELASNNGNWQWSAGTGCDAAPYFRIFNPTEQIKKFDKEGKYLRQWIPELDELHYPAPIVEHKFARARALEIYKQGIIE